MVRRGRQDFEVRGMILMLAALGSLPAQGLELSSRHHPVGVKIPDDMQLPDDWQGNKEARLACNTCHGVEDLEDKSRDQIDPESDDFLREGPWKPLTDFCFQCHDEKPYQRLNIHQQLDEQGKLLKQTCLYCHEKQPDRERPPKLEKLKLRLPADKICLGCHLKTPHLNALEHTRKPDEKILDKRQETIESRHVHLPLDSEGRVTCITCHSPHQKDVIDSGHPAGKQVVDSSVEQGATYVPSRWNAIYGADKKERLFEFNKEQGRPSALQYRRLQAEVLMRLPAKDGSLCRACHSFDD
jgi:nitrate/TMAO reductase-like tetraheme cytochrome c subunit